MDCDQCDQTFKQKKTLQKHLKQNHPRVFQSKYQCKICERSFSARRSLRRHSNLVHGEYINTLINNLQSDPPSEKQTESLIISDETFQLLEKSPGSINSKDSAENIPPLRRSKRIKNEINYFLDHQDPVKAEKSNKSKTKKVIEEESQYEVITLDSDSEETPEENSPEHELRYSKEELSPTVEITPLTIGSSQHFRSTLSRRLSETKRKTCKRRNSSHNLSLPNWQTQKKEGGPPCDQCSQVFPTRKDLERHVEDKHSFKCTRCVATIIFQTETAYKVHNERNHQD